MAKPKDQTVDRQSTPFVNRRNQFVNPENQTLLWTTIQTCPYLSRLTNPEEWFQTHIEQVYESNTQYSSLLQYNMEAIRRMLADLKQIALHEQQQRKEQQKQDHKTQQMTQWIEKDSQLKTDTTKDKPIRNMEELLAEQQKLRANDLPAFPKPQGEAI
jgi:hypothetical protein